VDDRPFFNAMGIGLDAEVSRRFNGLTHRGLPAYVRATLGVLRNARAQECTIIAGERRVTLNTLLIAVANSDQYGNNAKIAPGAHVDDGLLDLVAVKSASLLRLVTLVPRLFVGNLDESRHIVRFRASAFMIERRAPGLVHTDGETHQAGAVVSVRINPASLRVLVPATSTLARLKPARAIGGFALQFP
jgi:diacylglycerol kinase family enzyme